ncbi:interphotoreceptor matrix proteoglycan 1 isoform X2, partial [Silurus asotus]
NVKYSHEASRAARHLSAVQDSLILNRLRVKKSALFSTGVKACPQQYMAEVIAGRKSFYKLRVCQEAVWEAFQIFLDRVPDTTEFQQWVHACQTNLQCVEDLAHSFSSTQEHLSMMARRLSVQHTQEHAMTMSAPGEECKPIKTYILNSLISDCLKPKVSAVQYIIEFSVTVNNQGYSQLQSDPGNLQYQETPHSLHEQMLQIFNKLAGFKEIRLLGIYPGSVAEHYAVVFERAVDSTGMGPSETAGESGTEIALKNMVLKALRENTFVPLEIHSLSIEPTTQNHLKDTSTNKPIHLPAVISEQAVVAISEKTAESINSSGEETSPNGTQGRDKEAMESTFPTQETDKHLHTVTTLVDNPEPSPPEPSGGSKLKESEELNQFTKAEGYKRNTTLESPSKLSEVAQAHGNEIAAMPNSLNLNSIKAVRASTSNQYSEGLVDVTEASFKHKISVMPYFNPAEMPKAGNTEGSTTRALDVISQTTQPSGFMHNSEVQSTNDSIELLRFSLVTSPEDTSQHITSTAIPQTVSSVNLPSDLPGNFLNKKGQSRHTHSSHQNKACAFIKGLPSETDNFRSSNLSLDKDVAVFFSIRIANMIFSEDLVNESSPGYTSLKNTFLELLLQFLQSNLTGFKELHILSFRNGSMVVNNEGTLSKPVMDNITKTVHCTSNKCINTSSKRLDNETDTQSGDHNNPCKYMDCNEFSHCVVNSLTTEAECLCDPGYSTVDGLPCQSICNLNYCLNGGLCENIPGHGASCRCPAGKYWFYDGERCSDLVSLPVEPFIFILCLMGSLTVVGAVIGLLVYINRKCIQTRKTVTLV